CSVMCHWKRWLVRSLLITAALLPAVQGGAAIAQEQAAHELLEDSYVLEKDGWHFIHLEGSPYQIGFQRGYHAAESANYIIKTYLGPRGSDYHEKTRTIAREYIWPRIPAEYQEELQGTADGVKARGYDWDLWDIVAVNQWGDQGVFQEQYEKDFGSRCSAFIATGDATTDGQIVIGHNTWCPYNEDFMYNYIFEVFPDRGHDFRYQSAGACMWSGQDWYVNETGLMITETSLSNPVRDPEGTLLFVRIRRAAQYAHSIDSFLEIMLDRNNGAYPNEWLVGDAKTGEIMSLQLGCKVHDMQRAFNGFFGSSNHPWGVEFRDEADSPEPDPAGYRYARFRRWKQLKEEYYGEINVTVGRKMLSDHYDTYTEKEQPSARTICGHKELAPADSEQLAPSGAYDAKVTSSHLVLEHMGMWARWGHPCGMAFDVDAFLEKDPEWAEEHGADHVRYLRIFAEETPNLWGYFGEVEP
ncbi:MAG: hypothetical protein K9L28_08075, partial [Synergistales bacterium]|nr:hypothetical protein [Synergistales bacterium]